MNLPPTQEPDVDQMAREMTRANRKPLLIGLGLVVGVIVLYGVHVLRGFLATRAELEGAGYTDVQVQLDGPFSFRFAGLKGTAQCTGSMERLPFSISTHESCYEAGPSEPVAPKRPEAEVLAESLTKNFADIGVSKAVCDPVEPSASTATCKVSGPSGDPIDFTLVKRGDEWKVQKPERIIDRSKLAADIAAGLLEKTKTPIEVDCGTGLLGHGTGDNVTCSAMRKGAKTPGKVDVSFEAEGKYTWKGSGF